MHVKWKAWKYFSAPFPSQKIAVLLYGENSYFFVFVFFAVHSFTYAFIYSTNNECLQCSKHCQASGENKNIVYVLSKLIVYQEGGPPKYTVTGEYDKSLNEIITKCWKHWIWIRNGGGGAWQGFPKLWSIWNDSKSGLDKEGEMAFQAESTAWAKIWIWETT